MKRMRNIRRRIKGKIAQKNKYKKINKEQ